MEAMTPDRPIVEVAISSDGAGRPVVAVAGELDISSVDTLRQAVEGLLAIGHGGSTGDTGSTGSTGDTGHVDGAGGRGVVFDLDRLEFIDSSGIAFFLAVVNQAGSVELRHVRPTVRRVLQVTGLLDVLQVADS